jgi:hypothetical protein
VRIQVAAIVARVCEKHLQRTTRMYRCTDRLRAAREPQPMTTARTGRGGRGLRAPRPLSTTRALTHVDEANPSATAGSARIALASARPIPRRWPLPLVPIIGGTDCTVRNRVPHIDDWISD